MVIIIGIITVIYFVLIAWTWQRLGEIEKRKKVIFIAIGILIMYFITLVIFNLSKKEVDYQNEAMQILVKRLLVALFTGMNGILFIPYLAKIWKQLQENEIEKQILQKKIVIFAVLFIICFVFECGYLKNIQNGIVSIYQSMLE